MIERLKKIDWTRTMFLVPIFLVAGISISHVVTWYDMANPINWAVYLSIAIEVGAMTSLMAATKKIKGGVWFMFGLVTFIQMIGNIFYSYKEIDVNGELFKSWVELTGPIWEATGTDLNDSIGMRRWLAFLEGGLLPLISLTALHFFVKYEKSEETEEVPTKQRPSTDEVPTKELNEEEKQNVADEIIDSFIPDEKVFEELKYEEPLDGLDITEIPEEEFKKGRPVSEITKELAKDFKKKVKTEETLGPIEEENPLDEILEGLEETSNKDVEEEKTVKELPDIVKKTQEKFYPNTQVDDDGRRRVLEDDGKKKTLVYKKRNRGGQSSITRI
jgi:hypothetical protein